MESTQTATTVRRSHRTPSTKVSRDCQSPGPSSNTWVLVNPLKNRTFPVCLSSPACLLLVSLDWLPVLAVTTFNLHAQNQGMSWCGVKFFYCHKLEGIWKNYSFKIFSLPFIDLEELEWHPSQWHSRPVIGLHNFGCQYVILYASLVPGWSLLLSTTTVPLPRHSWAADKRCRCWRVNCCCKARKVLVRAWR